MKFHHVGIVLAAGFILLPNNPASAARPVRRILQSEGDVINLVAFDEADITVEGDNMSSESSSSSSGSSSCGGHHERCCLGEEILCYGGYGCYFGLNSTGAPDPSVPYPKCQPKCGGNGLPCCQSICSDDGCSCDCGPGTVFNVATKLCDECGMKKDQLCCESGCLSTDVDTGVALTCSRATGKCVECGKDDEAACKGGCLPGFVPQAGHICKACGEDGQPCCLSYDGTRSCDDGVDCVAGNVCKAAAAGPYVLTLSSNAPGSDFFGFGTYPKGDTVKIAVACATGDFSVWSLPPGVTGPAPGDVVDDVTSNIANLTMPGQDYALHAICE